MKRLAPHLLLFVTLLLGACADASEMKPLGGDILAAEQDPLHGPQGICADPARGCPCSGNEPAVACSPVEPPAALPGEPELCYQGTRYCEGGVYGPCMNVRAYAKAAEGVTSLVDQVSDQPPCSDCDQVCYRVVDQFNPGDGPIDSVSSGVSFHTSGSGISLTPALPMAIDAGIPDGAVPADSLVLTIVEGYSDTDDHATLHRPEDTDVYLLVDQGPNMSLPSQFLHDEFVTGTGYLPATTYCTDGDQTVLDDGIGGAIQCMVRDARFGVGMFRDIPFDPYATDTNLPVADQDADARREIVYGHHGDLDADPAAAQTAITQLGGAQSSGDPDFAASQIPALYSVATGDGHFTGTTRHNVPDHAGCTAGDYGYPCFRNGGDPIVVMLTDTPMHNGPDPASYPYDYDPTDLNTLEGTTPGTTSIPSTNDDFAAPYYLSSMIEDEYLVFLGDSEPLTPQIAASAVTCGADDAADDATFIFTVDTAGTHTIDISADQTSFDAALAIFDGPPVPQEDLADADNTNELFSSPYAFNDVVGRFVSTDGDTTDGGSDMGADYQGSLFGSCGGNVANSMSPDAVFSFNVAGAGGNVPLAVELDMGADNPVLAIYEGPAASLPRWPATFAPDNASGNDDGSPSNVWDVPGGDYVTVSGSTSALTARYDSADLSGVPACGATDGAKDAVFRLDVTGTKTLRLDTEGSDFDTVLYLHDRPPLTNDGTSLSWLAADTHMNTNEGGPTAWQTGPIDGLSQTFEGDTSLMTGDIVDHVGCGTGDPCEDAVYEIEVANRTTVRFGVTGTGFHPGLLITRQEPEGVSGNYPPLALGHDFSCAISGGLVYCWGRDSTGAMGNGGGPGDADQASALAVPGLTDVINICAGYNHVCALNDTGQVFCWGAGADGRLGDGNSTDAYSPVQVLNLGEGETFGAAVQVACGEHHSCALRADGQVTCWGSNTYGQLGHATTPTDEPQLVVTTERFKQIAAGGETSCAIRTSDQEVFCWGRDDFGQVGNGNAGTDESGPAVRQVTGDHGVEYATDISVGDLHVCVTQSDGHAKCWGEGGSGRIGYTAGSGSDADRYSPRKVHQDLDGDGDEDEDLTNVGRSIAAGNAHSCVVTLEGFTRCWGNGNSGELGNDSTSDEDLPQFMLDIYDATTVVAGYDHNCLVRTNGEIWCWGGGGNGELGSGSINQVVPVQAHAGATDPLSFGTGYVDSAFTEGCGGTFQRPEAGCQFQTYAGKGYYFCNTHDRNWSGAAQVCQASGMRLLDPDVDGENAFAANNISTDPSWIGVKRETLGDDWLEFDEDDGVHFTDVDNNRIYFTTQAHAEPTCLPWPIGCFGGQDAEGYFTGEHDGDLVDTDGSWNSSMTWGSDKDPRTSFGHNCAMLTDDEHWHTDNCSAVVEPACAIPIFCWFVDLAGALIGGFFSIIGFSTLAEIAFMISGAISGVFSSPHFTGGEERDYVCEARDNAPLTDIVLDPGSYFVTVKGFQDPMAASCAGPYALSIEDLGSPTGSFVACDDNGVDETQHSVVEETLADGTYYVVVKGKTDSPAEEGNYNLTVRDVDAVTTTEVACASAPGSTSVSFSADPTKSYYALVKGDEPSDKGPYTLSIRDQSTGSLIACDATDPDGTGPQLSLNLSDDTYYAVLKGTGAGEQGDYQLTIGGAAPVATSYNVPIYTDARDALISNGIRVATVLTCSGLPECADAQGQAAVLATDTLGTVRVTTPPEVPGEIVAAIETLESLDQVTAQVLFDPDAPDANPGFTYSVTPIADAGNGCTTNMGDFTDCKPGATPAFRVMFQDGSPPVPPSTAMYGEYEFALRVTGLRGGQTILLQDTEVFVVPIGPAPAGSYASGSYYQDFEAKHCETGVQRPSWDELHYDVDVPPDTRLNFSACSSQELADLALTCPGNETRVLTITGGTGAGTACTVATQDTDCPDGYCHATTNTCHYLEGQSCTVDADCPGGAAGSCRSGPSVGDIGDTCRVIDYTGDPGSALGNSGNWLPHMRVLVELESLGDGSETPAVFRWEAWYRCRNVE